MKKKVKRLLALVMSLAILFTSGIVPMTGSAADETYTTDYDTITLADLKDGNGASIVGTDLDNVTIAKGNYTYEGTSSTHSVVFKFGVELSISSGNDLKIALDDMYNESATLQMSSDNIRAWVGSNNRVKYGAITSGTHEIEIGRLRVLSGANAGKDYVYYKIDGTILHEAYAVLDGTTGKYKTYGGAYYTPAYVVGFATTNTENQRFYEIAEENTEAFTDDYDIVDLADLGVLGTNVSAGERSYDGTSATHSVIVRFGWEPNLEGNDWQLTLDKNWNAECMAWFRTDGTYLFPGYGSSGNIKKDAVTNSKHNVEFGRLRVVSGDNAGKDYVFLKIDGEVVASDYTNFYQTTGGYSDGYGGTVTPSYKIGLPSAGTSAQTFYAFEEDVEAFTEDYDIVDLADLGVLGTNVSAGERSYDGTSATHSVIVRFGWEPNLEGNDWQLTLDKNWNAECMAWFRTDGTYLFPGYGSSGNIKKDAVTNSKHNVEFGRLRVVSGDNAGKDYVFLKIDGEVVASDYTNFYQTAGGYSDGYGGTVTPSYKIGLPSAGTSAQTFYEYDDGESDSPYAPYDIVTLADLGLTGTDWVTTIEPGEYSYEGTSETHSVIVKFGWDANITSSTDFKVALDTNWNEQCMVWFKSDAVRTYVGDGNRVKTTAITSGRHDVEFGRLRVVTGENAGKDYVYLKIDEEVIAEGYTNYYQTSGGYIYSGDKTTELCYKVCFPTNGTSVQGFSGFASDNTEKFTEDYDTVTLAELGLTGTDWVTTVNPGEYSYEGTSATHSVVVKFGWDANVDTTSTPEIDFKIALDTNWNEQCMVWFKSDAVRTYVGDGNRVKTSAITSGRHNVEFGRLRVVSGENAGKDYVYLKIDEEVIAEGYTNYYQTSGGYIYSGEKMVTPCYKVCFPTSGTSIQGFSGFAPIVEPEKLTDDYDTVTLADLGLTGTDWETIVNPGEYTYDGTSATYSVVVKFGWDAYIDTVSSDNIDFKVALDTNWNEKCMVWFKSDAVRTYIGSAGNVKTTAITSGKHDIEFGRLRVIAGANTGKDYVYLKIDDELVASGYTDYYQTSGGYVYSGEKIVTPCYKVCFPTQGTKKQGFSGFADPDILVTDIDYINIGDIVPGGVVKDTIHGSLLGYDYPCELTSKTNSTVVRYVVDIDQMGEGLLDGSVMVVDIGGNCGFCRAYLSKGCKDGTTNKTSIKFGWEIDGCPNNGNVGYTFESNNWYAIEQGRIRVASGTNAGKDYIYLKINGETVYYFYGEPTSRPLGGQQIYIEATEAIQVVGYNELRAKYYVDGALYLDQHAQKGFTAHKPTDPKKSGSYFVGWYTAETGGKLFDFANTTLTKNINLYARFTTETVTATFDNGRGVTTPVTVGKGCLITKQADPASYTEGGIEYIFTGWKNETTGEILDFETDRISADTTFIAQYKEKEYYVSYYANGTLIAKVPFTLSNPTVEGKEPAVPTLPNTTGKWEAHAVSGLTKSITVNAVYTVKVPSASTAITLTANYKLYLNTDTIHNYLTTEAAMQTAFVREFNASTHTYQDYQNTIFKWTDSGKNSSYTVYFADNKEFKNAYIVTTSSTSLINEVGIFVPGETYYWFVCGSDTKKCSAVSEFTTVNTPVRYITADNVINMRDLGGQVNEEGKKVKYGLVYRGAALDEYDSHIEDAGRNVFNYLGINSEIELRGGYAHDYTAWDENNSNVYNITGAMYQEILSLSDDQKAAYIAAFEAMADESNYPFYFHCSAGADRTGTFAYLLYGMLGVPYDDIRPEYELTSFSAIGLRAADSYSGDQSLDGTYSQMLAQYGDGSGDLQVAVRNFLTQYVGVSSTTLDKIAEIMLDDGSNPNETANKITVDVLGKTYTYEAFDSVYFMPEAPKAMGKLFVAFYKEDGTKYNGYTNSDIKLIAKFEDIEYEQYDAFSLKELGITEDKILNQANTVYTYDANSESGGRLFSFVLEPIGDMQNGDGPQVAFTNDWSQISHGRVWFQSNTMSHVYYTGNDSLPDLSKALSLEPGKQYKIQFAVRIMKNKGYEGKKILEITVNDELMVQYIGTKADLNNNMVYFHGGSGSAYLMNDDTLWNNANTITVDVYGKEYTYQVFKNTYFVPKDIKVLGKLFKGYYRQDGTKYDGYTDGDIRLIAKYQDIEFEAYDTISLRDLGIEENRIVNKADSLYSYEKNAETGGRLFQFILEPIGDMKNGDGPQVSMTNDWSLSSFARVWFQSNTTSQLYYNGDFTAPDLTELVSLEPGKQYKIQFAVRIMKNKGYEGKQIFEVAVDDQVLLQYIGGKADLSGNTMYFHGGTGAAYLINDPVYHTVSFYNGETLVSSTKVLRGEKVKSIGELDDQGDLVFQGWFAEFGAKWDFDEDLVYTDTVLKARFQKRTYPVLLMVDGILYKRINVFAGECAEIYDVPTKDGYEFDTWLLEDGTEYDMGTPVNGPVTLVASFKVAASSTSADGDVSTVGNEKNLSSNLMYIMFSVIGLVVIAAETGVIIYKKRKNK